MLKMFCHREKPEVLFKSVWKYVRKGGLYETVFVNRQE